MKIEIGPTKPEHFKEYWPGQYELFSHYEYVAGVPSAVFLISTIKENGQPNLCLHAWSAFSGDPGGYFAILPGLMAHTHTYQNILRDKEFCVNFIAPRYYDACIKTIEQNTEDADEFAAGGFTPEPAQCVKTPRVAQAFLVYECTLESCTDLSGRGIISMVVGRVVHAAVNRQAPELHAIASPEGFMFNIHSPKDPVTGEGEKSAVARLEIVKALNE